MPSDKVLKEKQEFVKMLTEKLEKAVSIVLVDYKGIDVETDTRMRKELRESGVDYFVVKNTLLKFAVNETGLEELGSVLAGTTSIAISNDDVATPAKIIMKYVDEMKTVISVKAGAVEHKAVDAAAVKDIAKLPSKEILVAMLLRGMSAPISGMANVLNANLRGLAIALSRIAEDKEKQSA
ncbi:MAG: 50S ribosomal protein L10 [Oscillospiraceae bacterium]|nr:50S ribosomal protein L10 [Oscillospiraceae bacterium]